MFIPELTTRVTVNVDTNELDSAISMISDSVLSDCGITEELEQRKDKLLKLKQPLAAAIGDRLQSNQENIIQSKHYLTGMMSNSVDITEDGDDVLVGNTASSPLGFPYPLAIEKGTKAHWVEPITFSALHWGGTPGFFSKGHMVSGITADPFVDPSITNTIWDIDEILDGLDL